MYHSPPIGINKRWVELHQNNFMLEDVYGMVVIDDTIKMSTIKDEFEFSIISLSITDEIDPLFLSTPIPHGNVRFSFADNTQATNSFYDEVLERFQKGMSVHVSLGYNSTEKDTVEWFGHEVTDAKMDAVKKEVTVSFEHVISLLSGKQTFPFWSRLVGTVGVVRQILATRKTPFTVSTNINNVNIGVSGNINDYMSVLTSLQNTMPMQLVTSNYTGNLTMYAGYHAEHQDDVSIWEGEVIGDSLRKELFDVGDAKYAGDFTIVGDSVTQQTQSGARVKKLLPYSGSGQPLMENDPERPLTHSMLNYLSMQETHGEFAVNMAVVPLNNPERLTTWTVPDSGDNAPYSLVRRVSTGYQTAALESVIIKCDSDVGSRCVFTPMNFSYISLDIPSNVWHHSTRFYDMELRYSQVVKPRAFGKQAEGTAIENPFGANIDACYTFPKENFKFTLSGTMRDNASFKPNQVIRIPYEGVWANLLLTKLTRTYAGGSRLEFEGVVISVTEDPVITLTIDGYANIYLNDTMNGHTLSIAIHGDTTTPALFTGSAHMSFSFTIPDVGTFEHEVSDFDKQYTYRSDNMGPVSQAQWDDAFGSVTLSYRGLTTTETILKNEYDPIPEISSPIVRYFNAGQDLDMLTLPNE